jgi:hypothetical protein
LKTILSKIGFLVVLFAVAAQPATISFSDDFTTTFSPSSFDLEIPAFDSSLGTLTEVLVEFAADFAAELTFTNGGGSDGEVGGSYSASFALSGPGLLGVLISLAPSASLAPAVAVPAGTTVGPVVLSGADTGSATLTDPGDLATFVGAGSLILPVGTMTINALSANFSPFILSGSASGNSEVTVTYTYDPVDDAVIPEPGSFALLGTGLALVLAGTWRKRSRI